MLDATPLEASIDHDAALADRYARALRSVRKDRLLQQGEAAGLMFAALAYEDALKENRPFALASHWAQLFCIAAAGIIPILLLVREVF